MSLSFAWAEGAVAAILAVSAALVDEDLNALTGQVLYAAFCVGTLVAPASTFHLGLKRSLVIGLLGWCLFAASFISPTQTVLVFAACVSGILGSILWTAQGAYFTMNAIHYSEATYFENPQLGVTVKDAIGLFSGIFAGIFPFALALCKLVSSVILQSNVKDPTVAVYSVYTALAVICTLSMCTILPMSTPPTAEPPTLKETLLATVKKLSDARMVLLIPTNVCFGVTAAYFPVLMTPMTSDSHGKHFVGYMYATSGFVAAAFAYPLSRFSNYMVHGRSVIMVFGGFCYSVIYLVMWFVSPTDIFSLAVLFILYGIGNTVWQGTCMAVFADIWHDDPAPAFANLKLHSGLASTIAYGAFVGQDRSDVAAVCFFICLIGVFCYLILVYLSDTSSPRNAIDSKLNMYQVSSIHTAFVTRDMEPNVDVEEPQELE